MLWSDDKKCYGLNVMLHLYSVTTLGLCHDSMCLIPTIIALISMVQCLNFMVCKNSPKGYKVTNNSSSQSNPNAKFEFNGGTRLLQHLVV